MKRITFNPVKNIKAVQTDVPSIIRLTGPKEAINKVINKLTIKNKSIKWSIDRLFKTRDMWADRIKHCSSESNAFVFYQEKINQIDAEIESLRAEEEIKLYDIDGDDLIVPAGMWWIAEKTDGSNENNSVVPVYLNNLRDYQREAITNLLKWKRSGIVCATGLGKSVIISSLCKTFVNAGKRVCVIVPTEYLVGQMIETIGKEVDSITGMGGKRNYKFGCSVAVTTAQSAKKIINDFDVLSIDEGQHNPASTWVDMLSEAKAEYAYFFTATPFRADGLDMAIHSFVGPVVYERSARWGIENGWLKPCKVYLKKIDYSVGGKTKWLGDNLNAQKAYKILTTNPDTLQELKRTILKLLNGGRRVIVLFKTVNACIALKTAFKGELDFDVASSKFKKPIDDFRAGTINLLVSNDKLIGEGVDIPSADALVMVTQNSSPVTTYQAVGRVLRKSPGFAIVIDVTLNGFTQFVRTREARAKVYSEITNDVFQLGD